MKTWTKIIIILIVLSLGYFGYQKLFNQKYHIHADFAMFIDGEQFNFAQSDYMTSTDTCSVDYNTKHTHLHNENGNVIHIHEKDQAVSNFFNSLGFVITDDAITTDTKIDYKNTNDKKWRFFVNNKEVASIQNYIFEDLDQILLTYGDPKKDIGTELTEVTKQACIYSKKCPKPADVILPTELCGTNE